jgi:hypothetical protein
VCNAGKPVEQGIANRPFYAKDLDRKLRDKAAAVCIAAAVKEDRYRGPAPATLR